MDDQLDSGNLARYIEEVNGISKPWLLAQLRLKKMQENREHMTATEYEAAIASLQADLMNLGEWWVGIEDEAFG